MKKFLMIIPALLILGSLSLAQEFSITAFNNTIDIQDQNSVNETISFTVVNTGNTTLSLLTYNLEQNPNNLVVFQDGSSLPFNVSKINTEYQIAISTLMQPNESKNFTLKFNPVNLVSSLDDKYILRLDFSPEKTITN